MSIFTKSDYSNKKETFHKTKLPIKFVTKKHKCSQCTRTDAVRYPITKKESRWLCPLHVALHNRGRIKDERPFFVKAGKLRKESD